MKSETAELLEKAEENIRTAARNYLISPAPPTHEINLLNQHCAAR